MFTLFVHSSVVPSEDDGEEIARRQSSSRGIKGKRREFSKNRLFSKDEKKEIIAARSPCHKKMITPLAARREESSFGEKVHRRGTRYLYIGTGGDRREKGTL